MTDEELQKVFNALDVDNTGTVDALEFIAGVMHVLNPAITNNVFEASFKRLDRCDTVFFGLEGTPVVHSWSADYWYLGGCGVCTS